MHALFVLLKSRHLFSFFQDYDGKSLRGSINLSNSRTVPVPGTPSFEIHTPSRVYHLSAEHMDMVVAHE